MLVPWAKRRPYLWYTSLHELNSGPMEDDGQRAAPSWQTYVQQAHRQAGYGQVQIVNFAQHTLCNSSVLQSDACSSHPAHAMLVHDKVTILCCSCGVMLRCSPVLVRKTVHSSDWLSMSCIRPRNPLRSATAKVRCTSAALYAAKQVAVPKATALHIQYNIASIASCVQDQGRRLPCQASNSSARTGRSMLISAKHSLAADGGIRDRQRSMWSTEAKADRRAHSGSKRLNSMYVQTQT